MGLLEQEQIDKIGRSGDTLVLVIDDDVSWEQEIGHMALLEYKIDRYLDFLDEKQYETLYPGITFSSFVIEMHFSYVPGEMLKKFVQLTNNGLREYNIKLESYIK